MVAPGYTPPSLSRTPRKFVALKVGRGRQHQQAGRRSLQRLTAVLVVFEVQDHYVVVNYATVRSTRRGNRLVRPGDTLAYVSGGCQRTRNILLPFSSPTVMFALIYTTYIPNPASPIHTHESVGHSREAKLCRRAALRGRDLNSLFFLAVRSAWFQPSADERD